MLNVDVVSVLGMSHFFLCAQTLGAKCEEGQCEFRAIQPLYALILKEKEMVNILMGILTNVYCWAYTS